MPNALVFKMDDKILAIDLEKITEILRAVYVTPLPKPVKGVSGYINLRGRLLPVVDLSELWTGEKSLLTYHSRFISCQINKNDAVVVIVEQVLDVVESDVVDNMESEMKLSLLENDLAGYCVDNVFSVDEQIIMMIDLHTLLNEQQRKNLQQLTSP